MALLRFYADRFCQACGVLGQSRTLLEVVGGMDRRQLSIVGANLGELRRQCEQMELPIASRRIRRFLESLDTPDTVAWAEWSRQLTDVYQSVVDELESRTVLCISPDKATLYSDHDHFSSDVSRNFPSTSGDILEAAKCLALNRNTACVFHLMRVMEVGLRALGASLHDPRLDPKRNPSWDTILKKGDEELIKPLAQRAAEWQTDEPFFSTAHANLRAVKDAWRNPTMHVERTYDDETALEVWNAVKGFMRHLAMKLSETDLSS